LILRNAFGGAYAAFNSYATGADIVLALPTTRVAVMGPAGKEYVYKAELKAARDAAAKRRKAGDDETAIAEWLKSQEGELNQRYERELMNPREALSLGSISEIVMPADLRRVLAQNLEFLLRHYVPCPMTGVQREFH
jgi:acetyl-CoA carboxylase carboxyltransferase component